MNSKATMKKLSAMVGRYRIYLVFSILLAAVSVVMTLYVPVLFGDAIDGIVSPGNVDFESVYAILH